jgi:hypothetical protein
MRRSRLTSFDGKQSPLTLADGLRTVFADFASEPFPESLRTQWASRTPGKTGGAAHESP